MTKIKKTKEEQAWINKKNRIYRTYGLEWNKYDLLLARQNGKCAICKLEKPLCIDHVHIRGFKKMLPEQKVKYVRGLCCFMCNTGIKCVEKTIDGKRNREQLEGMHRYFTIYPLKGEIE